MASADLLAWLGQSTLAGSMAVAAVLLVRRPMRRLFGARVAYALWIVVPLALLAKNNHFCCNGSICCSSSKSYSTC